jgi:uncharacterized protein YebE (UPF0316 family)
MIFFAKLMEVSIATVRVVLTARGNRLISSLLASVEVTLWIIVASTVLLGITDDPLRAVVYVLAYAIGIYAGIAVEDKLALGLAQIEAIAEIEEAKLITEKLRGLGYGVTTYACEGLEGQKLSMVLKVHRKDIPMTLKLLKDYEHLFVTITDIRKLPVGIIKRKMLMK